MDGRRHDRGGVRAFQADRTVTSASAAPAPSSLALALGLLLAALALAYLPSLGASFQFDDWNVIVRDPRVQSLAAWLASMPGIRPLLKLSYALNHELGGGTAAFRAVNVGVHALNSALVAVVLRGLGLRLALEPRAAGLAALVAAAVFALHPVQTEAVTYVSGRSTSLSTSFALLALLAWLRGLDTPAERRWRWASLVVFALALGVKEAPVALPLVMSAWLVGRRAHRASIPRRVAPHFALLLAGGVFVVLAWPPYRAVLDGEPRRAQPIGTNLLTPGGCDRLAARPAAAHSAACSTPTRRCPRWWHRTCPTRCAPAPCWQWRARACCCCHVPLSGFAIVWFFVWLLPTNSLVPRLDVVNDRQLYLAIVGPGWLLGLAVRTRLAALRPRHAAHRPRRAAPPLGVALLAAGLATATRARNRVYADEIAFWRDVARKSPRNARAANNLGYAYALACRDAEALAEFARAMRSGATRLPRRAEPDVLLSKVRTVRGQCPPRRRRRRRRPTRPAEGRQARLARRATLHPRLEDRRIMHGYRVSEFGGVEVMKWVEMPDPVPGPGQLRVAVRASGINFAETRMRAGTYSGQALPFVMGMEAAGIVEAVGPGVKAFSAGDRVFGRARGSHATHVLFDVEHTLPLPDSLDFVQGAAIPVGWLTAWHALVTVADAQPRPARADRGDRQQRRQRGAADRALARLLGRGHREPRRQVRPRTRRRRRRRLQLQDRRPAAVRARRHRRPRHRHRPDDHRRGNRGRAVRLDGAEGHRDVRQHRRPPGLLQPEHRHAQPAAAVDEHLDQRALPARVDAQLPRDRAAAVRARRFRAVVDTVLPMRELVPRARDGGLAHPLRQGGARQRLSPARPVGVPSVCGRRAAAGIRNTQWANGHAGR